MRHLGIVLGIVLGGLAGPAAAQEPGTSTGLFRNPDVSRTHLVFVYADDLWIAPREGGVALPLASPAGLESTPRFSPDGTRIAFVGNYDGNRDLYVVPVTGGVPARVTHHPAGEALADWTPDGRLLFATNAFASNPRIAELFTVAADGGLPERVSVPQGLAAAVSPDGEWLAYTPHSTDSRTWKRYRGGLATDLWLWNLKKRESRRVTTWEGTDTWPMWHGKTLYYVSDAGDSHRLNLWAYDLETKAQTPLTRFPALDVKWPAIGPGPDGKGEIVFQCGSGLRRLDCATREIAAITLEVPGARPTLRPQPVDAAKQLGAWHLAPSGKRAACAARGDVWTCPAEHGTPRNLTRTSGVAERDPSWSPDGKSIAYLSDATGEYEVWVAPADGTGEPRQVTSEGAVFRFAPQWSPDGKWLVFTDKTYAIWLCDVATGATRLVDRDPWGLEDDAVGLSWSADSRWLAYARNDERARTGCVWVHDVPAAKSTRVTDPFHNAAFPVFDRAGDYCYFRSNRHFAPRYGELDNAFIYAGSEVLLCVPLRADQPSPFAPKSDEEGEEKKKDEEKDKAKEDGKKENGKDEGKGEGEGKKGEGGGDGKKDDAKAAAPKPVTIEIDGFERRAVRLPVKPGVFGRLGVNDKGALLYVRRSIRGTDEPAEIQAFDPKDEKREEKTVAKGGDFVLSADGKKLLVPSGNGASIQDAGPGATGKPVVTAGMTAWVDPRAEWRQLLVETWRLQRDLFYDAGLHGVDWPGMRTRYAAMIADCVTREDVGYVLRELISELNVGHAYYWSGPSEETPNLPAGLLGVDFERGEGGAYRIARIPEGAVFDAEARGPLSQPGVGVRVGDYVLAVNGLPVDPRKDPWAAFLGTAGRAITLTVSQKPVRDETARTVVVATLESESGLRYRAWIERTRQWVREKSGGRIGYLHVPDTGVNGQNELVRQFYGQVGCDALIVDERWNGGGQIPTRFVELLDRPITNYWARRDGRDWPWPADAHQGPKCMLINGHAGSGGDAFPAYFKQRGLGKLIGTRTWGGLVGITGVPRLIDGTQITVPSFAYYKKDGTWGIEGHGVDPDLVVEADPLALAEGRDPQLEAAVTHLLAELERAPYTPPTRPAPPDRKGMGIPEKDR